MTLNMNTKVIGIDSKDAVGLIKRGILKRSNFIRNNASDDVMLENVPVAYAKRINSTAHITIDGIRVAIGSPDTIEKIYNGDIGKVYEEAKPAHIDPVPVEEVVEPEKTVEETTEEIIEVSEVTEVMEEVVESQTNEETVEESVQEEVIEETPVEEESTVVEKSLEVEGNYTEYITDIDTEENNKYSGYQNHKKKKKR